MITASELSWMRTEQNRALPGTAVIERATLTSDGMGGYTETWAAVGTVSGRLMPRDAQSQEMLAGGEITSLQRWWMTLPHGTDVKEQDRISWNGRTFEVIGVGNDESYQTAVRCEVMSLNEEARE